jgi:separase
VASWIPRAEVTDPLSAIAMPMGLPAKRPSERLSSRIKIQNVLERAEFAFRSALELFTDGAPVEVVRQARLNLALLHAFQTSLQHGSDTVTAAAADILGMCRGLGFSKHCTRTDVRLSASNASMTFHRERLEAIDCKFAEVDHDDLKWPSVSDIGTSMVPLEHDSDTDMEDDQLQFRAYWGSIKSRHVAAHSIPTEPLNLSSVPPDWAVISINVTEDHNTMFISRHQRNHQPLVFCLPLDRQGRREGEDEADLFTFDTAAHEMEDIIRSSNDSARNAKNVETREQKAAWWEERYGLDKRMEEMLLNMEFVWLGPFKVS